MSQTLPQISCHILIFVLIRGKYRQKQEKDFIVLNPGNPPERKQRIAEFLAVQTVFHIILMELNLYFQGLLGGLTLFIGDGLSQRNGTGKVLLCQTAVPALIGGEILLQQSVQVLLPLPLGPVKGGLEEIAQEQRIGQSAVLRTDLLQSRCAKRSCSSLRWRSSSCCLSASRTLCTTSRA